MFVMSCAFANALQESKAKSNRANKIPLKVSSRSLGTIGKTEQKSKTRLKKQCT